MLEPGSCLPEPVGGFQPGTQAIEGGTGWQGEQQQVRRPDSRQEPEQRRDGEDPVPCPAVAGRCRLLPADHVDAAFVAAEQAFGVFDGGMLVMKALQHRLEDADPVFALVRFFPDPRLGDDGDGDGIYNPVDLNGNYQWDPNEDKPDLILDETTIHDFFQFFIKFSRKKYKQIDNNLMF